jgi:purine-binding chemotaxis protein CheW
MQESVAHDSRRYLTLTLGSESFAIGINAVREILDYTEITRIPQAPPSMRGVVNVRGAAVPVVDLAQKLGLGEVQRTINTRIVIMEVTRDGVPTVMGALADSVREVLELDSDGIAPPPRMGAKDSADCLRGIGNHDGRFILVLDVDRVFATDDLIDMAGLLTSASPDAGDPVSP